MLKARLKNGILAAAVLVSLLFLAPAWMYLLIVLTVCTLAMLEFYQMLEKANIPSFRFVGIAAALLLNLSVWGVAKYAWNSEVELAVLFAVIAAIFLRQLSQKHNRKPFETVSGTLLGVLYIGFLLSFLTRIMMFDGLFNGQWLLFYLLVIIKVSDSGAYFAGTNLGRHKMAPRLSPKKTWEGFAGGMAAGLLASLALYYYRGGDFDVVRMELSDAIMLGLLLPGAGVLGDLFESLCKRAAGIKDSSAGMKGLGGLMDLADSVLPATPILYLWARFFLVAPGSI